MEILIFHIWVCNKKDIVFSVRIFLEFATLKLHIKLKKGHERQNKVHGIQKKQYASMQNWTYFTK